MTLLVGAAGSAFYVLLLGAYLGRRSWRFTYGAVAIAAGIHGGLMLGLAWSKAACLLCYVACGVIWCAMLLIPSEKFIGHVVRYSTPALAARLCP